MTQNFLYMDISEFLNKSTAYRSIIRRNLLYICISKYLKKGHNSVRKGRTKNSSLDAQQRIISDTPRRFQDHPLIIVGVLITRIC